MSVVRRFADAFNHRDVEGLLACFTPDAGYTDNFYGLHRGSAALRAMFERMFHEGKDYRWTMELVVEGDRHAAAEWSFAYAVSDAVPRSAGRQVRFKGTSVFELADGRIAAYREYFDTGAVLLQLGFAPESLVKVLRRKQPA